MARSILTVCESKCEKASQGCRDLLPAAEERETSF